MVKKLSDSKFIDMLTQSSLSGGGRIVGWYSYGEMKVPFYITPSWFDRQKMRWIFGWKWTWNKENL